MYTSIHRSNRVQCNVRLFRYLLLIFALAFSVGAQALQILVQAPDGTPVTGFRWLIEEDTTHPVILPLTDPPLDGDPALVSDSLSLDIHRSYAPIALDDNGNPAMGRTTGSSVEVNLNLNGRYVLSILPDADFTIGGATIANLVEDTVTVTVNPLPIKTAQVSVYVFHDNSPINNVPDLPQELGLEGFNVFLVDLGGQVIKDAFGNPLGTIYQVNDDGTVNFNPDGTPAIVSLGNGTVLSDAEGHALIRNLVPGRYEIQVIPPTGSGWQQTSTLEGTPFFPVWIKANEPQVFADSGFPPHAHAFFGFIQPFNDLPVTTTPGTITGTVVNAHNAVPPDFTFSPGHPLPNCWVGLNDLSSKVGVFAAPCDDSSFTIADVPPGDYELAIWDRFLDNLFALHTITVEPDGFVDLGNIPTFRWRGYSTHVVFLDHNENGFRDCYLPDGVTPSGDPADCYDFGVDDTPLAEQNINLRFRDGSIYQALPTDNDGLSPFEEVFPFFKFLVAEVDYARYKATGVTVITDGGGEVLPDQGWDWPSRGVLTPQKECTSVTLDTTVTPAVQVCNGPIINPNTGNELARTVTGPVLTLAQQTFPNLTNWMEWGKKPHVVYDFSVFPPTYVGENGGISGIVFYATTRAENDPRFAVGEEWEPGVPRVQVNLYTDGDTDLPPLGAPGGICPAGTVQAGPEDTDWNNNGCIDPDDGAIDDVNGVAGVQLADVDNHPFGWSTGGGIGPEDVDRNLNGTFDPGDAIQITTTDSWDDNLPTGCNAPLFEVNGGTAHECFEGLRTFNQVRDGVFDGGYAFFTGVPQGVGSGNPEIPLPTGEYIVEATTPPGYDHLKEEDKNVDFGDDYIPTPQLLPPKCVGSRDPRYPALVPDELTLFPGVEAPFAGLARPLCNQKLVGLAGGQNAAADFFLYTEVPKAGRIIGFVLNDLANDPDPNSPSFGEKVGADWLPISIQDSDGREVARAYTDQFGGYNFLIPSTYTKNVESPTGVSPNIYKLCLNDPGPIVSPDDPSIMIIDPRHDPGLAQLCYSFDAWPGKITYLDTPILPIVASSGRTDYPLDCALPDGSPVIHEVNGPIGGPYVAAAGAVLTINSPTVLGPVMVANPRYAAGNGEPLTIPRDFGFGATPGTVSIGGVEIDPLTVGWGPATISFPVPASVTTGELVITRGDNGRSTETGITVTVGGPAPIYVPVGGSIQAAIDSAAPGDLIMVPPGLAQPDGTPAPYEEFVVMWKPVRLQGYGAGSSRINVAAMTPDDVTAWRARIDGLVAAGDIDLLPSQTGIPLAEEGAGIFVAGLASGLDTFAAHPGARIDGLSISGAVRGSGIYVNGYASQLQITNNRVTGNSGIYGGGIRLGHPFLDDGAGNFVYQSAFNDSVEIRNNQVSGNGTKNAAGGGIGLFHGSDNYLVAGNYICGNFSAANGAGIGHVGLSHDGIISDNTILFNQAFQQTAGFGGGGGGLYLSGGTPLAGDTVGPGAGNITLDSNLIMGNQGGTADGGGILAEFINGNDVATLPITSWYALNIFNNMIVNNISGLAGAVTLKDVVNADIRNNTIAHNDSTATAAAAFSGNINVSNPQPAGVVSRAHTPGLAGLVSAGFSDPVLENNIIWQNRSFYWDVNRPGGQGLLPDVATPVFDDLAVLGFPGSLSPTSCVVTDTTGLDPSNTSLDPAFFAAFLPTPYFNGGPSYLVNTLDLTPIETIPAFDEGGNFIDISMGPLTRYDDPLPGDGIPGTLFGDYHIQETSPARDAGAAVIDEPLLAQDFDGDTRPSDAGVDIGADEVQIGGPGPLVAVPQAVDTDVDGIPDQADNCPAMPNADQADKDSNGVGDVCEPPRISGIWASGQIASGNTVSLFVFGDYFGSATQVSIAGIRQWLVQVETPEMLIARITITPDMIGMPVDVCNSAGCEIGPPVVEPPPALNITGLWPGTVTAGVPASVFVSGSGFDQTPGATQVFFNGLQQQIVQAITPDLLIVRFTPGAAMAGPVTVTTPEGSVVGSIPLQVTP